MNDLIEINDLKELLGYSDLRSVRTWCLKNNVPLVVLGRKTYTYQHLLKGLVDERLSAVDAKKDISQHQIETTRSSTKSGLGRPAKQIDFVSKHKRTMRAKNMHSRAATDLINSLNSAD